MIASDGRSHHILEHGEVVYERNRIVYTGHAYPGPVDETLDAGNAACQPFPSVWPVRTLRSDVEPDNFVAKLGLYSMDNGSPLAEGTWVAAKAGADAALSAAMRVAQGLRAAFCCTPFSMPSGSGSAITRR